MSNRPDFKSYLKYHYRKILGTTYARNAITCRSGIVYAMVDSTLFKILRVILLGTGIIILTQREIFIDFYINDSLLIIGVCYFALIAFMKLLQYFFARCEELDDTNNLCLERASRSIRPPFWDYVKSIFNGYSEFTIYNDFENFYGQKYRESPNEAERFVLLFILFIWVLVGSFFSVLSNIVIFFGLIALYLLISPVRYLYTDFKVSSHDNHTTTPNISNGKTVRGRIMRTVTTVFFAVIFIYFIFFAPYPLPDAFTARIRSDIRMTEQTTFEEAFKMAHAHAEEQCGDAQLYRFYIYIDGEDALKAKQPTEWVLDFQHLPAGLFDPTQKINIDKTSETRMTAYRFTPSPRVSMENAPTISIDVDEILTILETNLGISLDDTSFIKISGGSDTYEQLPRNTFKVRIDTQDYIVDVVKKTARKE